MRLRHRIAIVATSVVASVMAPAVVGAVPHALAHGPSSIDCIQRAGGSYICEVRMDDGSVEYWVVS